MTQTLSRTNLMIDSGPGWEKEVSSYYTFIEKGTFMSFDSLQTKYGLERSDFYRYLQVRHYFNQNLDKALKTNEAGIFKVVLSTCKSEMGNKVISRLAFFRQNLKIQFMLKRNGKYVRGIC